jgi:nucleoside-diphosphate-sugar epimerase
MRIFLTGATGFVGNRLLKKLLKKNFSVRAISRSKKKLSINKIQIIEGDLTSSELDLTKAILNCDVILNCAGEIRDKNKMKSLHVEATIKMLNAVERSFELDGKQKHWIQLSSVGAYGKSNCQNTKKIITEKSPLNPIGEYEETKTIADNLIISFAKKHAMTYTILRPSNIVGYSMPNQSFLGLLKAIKKRKFFYIGSKESIATYVHVDDVVDALILSITSSSAKNQVFNISNDCRLSEIINNIAISCGIKSNFLCIPEKPLRFLVSIISRFIKIPLSISRIDALTSKTYYPNTKISDILNFTPKYNIPQFAVLYLNKMNSNDR